MAERRLNASSLGNVHFVAIVLTGPHGVVRVDCKCIWASIASVDRRWSIAEPEGGTGDGTASRTDGRYPEHGDI